MGIALRNDKNGGRIVEYVITFSRIPYIHWIIIFSFPYIYTVYLNFSDTTPDSIPEMTEEESVEKKKKIKIEGMLLNFFY